MTTVTIRWWLEWVVAGLALAGFWAVLAAAGLGARRVRDWWRDRREPLTDEESDWETPCPGREDGIHCEHWYDGERCCSCGDDPLPPERSREELGFTGEQPAIDLATHYPDGRRRGFTYGAGSGREPFPVLGEPARERRAPWWEAEHRAAYQSLGLDYPSGLLARVREQAP